MTDNTMPLSHYISGNEVKLSYKDLGPQVGWTTVFLVEYFGPMLITALLALFQEQIYGRSLAFSLNQKLGMAMIFIHYGKREVETSFVHRFSLDTMPIMNIFKNSMHYWIILGVFCMYFYVSPDYTSPAWCTDTMHYVFFGLFLVCEFMNLQCHLVLKNLRRPGTTERGIPKGWGFDQVSCANYFWESLVWLIFAVNSQCVGAYFFWILSSG